MKSILKKGLVFCFALAILLASYPQDVFAKENLIRSESSDERQNLKFLTGKPGDTYLVYTYDENGKSYKVVESATDNFKSVNSVIYELNSNNVYKKYSTQTIKTLEDNSLNIVINVNGKVHTEK